MLQLRRSGVGRNKNEPAIPFFRPIHVMLEEMMLALAGKGALVVGTKRIGATIARRLAHEGTNLAIAYRNSQASAERLHEDVAFLVERSCLVQGDINIEKDVRRILETTEQQLGGLYCVINLASDFRRMPFDTLDGDSWDAACAAARGSYLLSVYAARRMMLSAGPTRGHIVMFGDWAAKETPYRDYLPYLISKASIDFMTRGFAVELAPYGILVNSIAPGPTVSPPDLSEDSWQRDVLDQTPLRRESAADEIAELVVTLLKSETITGETVRVDSGRHLAGP